MSVDPKGSAEISHAPVSRGQVVMFRPRDAARGRKPSPAAQARDSNAIPNRWPEPWETCFGDEREEHPHHTLINVIGIGCTLLLIGTGLWLAHTLVEMRQIQDCVLSGRTNCAPIEVRSIRP